MKRMLALLTLATLTSCSSGPPKPRHVAPAEYMSARSHSADLGESQDHAFRKKADGPIIYTDTEDLPASERSNVQGAGKTYNGPGSKVRWH